jgi:hypothetical protein
MQRAAKKKTSAADASRGRPGLARHLAAGSPLYRTMKARPRFVVLSFCSLGAIYFGVPWLAIRLFGLPSSIETAAMVLLGIVAFGLFALVVRAYSLELADAVPHDRKRKARGR